MKRHYVLGWFACVFGLSTLSLAQAVPTASRSGSLQLGIGATFVRPDYGGPYAKGPTVYGTFDFRRHFGVEGDIHLASYFTPHDLGEDTYLVGPRYVVQYKRFDPYIKGLAGIGRIFYQFDNKPHSSATYIAYALGAGLDVKATRRLNVRALDVEFQNWPGYASHGLSPIAITVGVAYTFP